MEDIKAHGKNFPPASLFATRHVCNGENELETVRCYAKKNTKLFQRQDGKQNV